jgi:hypothetical protein
MKKRHYSISLLLCVFCGNVLQAQIDRPRRVEVGLIAGPSIDWSVANTKGYKNEGVRIGGVYGLTIDINLSQTSSNYFFSTGINARHIRYGFGYKDNYLYYDEERAIDLPLVAAELISTFNTAYVSIPTAIKLKTNTFNRFVFWGLVGLEHGIAVSSKSNDEINHPLIGTRKTEKNNHYKETAVFKESLYVVLGIEFIIKDNTKATFGIGYDHGFNNMFKKDYINLITQKQVNIQTHRLEFQFGVIF